MFARINIWHYTLPALADRREDIAPNIEHQLALAAQELGRATRFNKEAYALYLDFALSRQSLWRGNFRDLAASIMRLATLAPQAEFPPIWCAPKSPACNICGRKMLKITDKSVSGLPENIRREDWDLFDCNS